MNIVIGNLYLLNNRIYYKISENKAVAKNYSYPDIYDVDNKEEAVLIGNYSYLSKGTYSSIKIGDKIQYIGEPTSNFITGEYYELTGPFSLLNKNGISMTIPVSSFESCFNVLVSEYIYSDILNIHKEEHKSPSYYNRGKIEVIDFIHDQQLNFNLGNVIKYISRAGFKDPNKKIEDLKKAKVYLEHEIKQLEDSEHIENLTEVCEKQCIENKETNEIKDERLNEWGLFYDEGDNERGIFLLGKLEKIFKDEDSYMFKPYNSLFKYKYFQKFSPLQLQN